MNHYDVGHLRSKAEFYEAKVDLFGLLVRQSLNQSSNLDYFSVALHAAIYRVSASDKECIMLREVSLGSFSL